MGRKKKRYISLGKKKSRNNQRRDFMYSVANTRVRTQEPLLPPEPPRVLLPTSPLSTDSKGLTLHASLFIMNIKHYGKKKIKGIQVQALVLCFV